ncbi:MAG: DNA polymerase I [Chloroflexi bacterium]|nr:DNA polymerase I [Chloroflexota bacterium]
MSEQANKRPLLVLVDGHAVAYRAFFSIKLENSHFFTTSGEPTNATFGFTRTILDILEDAPEYFAISFDKGLSGRDQLYPDYKGTREKMPDELRTQLGRIEEIVRAFNIPVLALEGYEADDVIGTVTQQAEEAGCDVLIVTGDKDLLQLVSPHTRVQLPQRGGPAAKGPVEDLVYDLDTYAARYPALQPHQLVDLKAFMGDNSDNIPGVAGIGEKGALALVQTFGSLEGVYERIHELKGSQKEKLIAGREMAFLSKTLATIKRDVPITLNLLACVTHDFDPEVVNEVFRQVEFRSMLTRLQKLTNRTQTSPTGQMSMFGEETPVVETPSIAPYETIIVTTPEQLAELAVVLNAATVIGFDTETTGLDKMAENLVGISLAVDGTQGYYIPVGHIPSNAPLGVPQGVNPATFHTNGGPHQNDLLEGYTPTQLPLQEVIEAIWPALTNPKIGKVAHNANYDFVMLRRYGLEIQPIVFDTMIAEWLTNTTSRFLGLKDLAGQRLNVQMQKIEELIGTGKNQISFARVAIEKAAPYAVADAVVVLPLKEQLEKELVERDLHGLLNEMEMPLVPVLADIEMHGVLLDLPFLKIMANELGERLAQLEDDIYLTSGYGKFNINSLPQLSDVLFGKLGLDTAGLKKTKKTKNFSLTADVLEEMRDQHPIIPMLLEYRQVQKLKSTYVEALPALVNKYTGRVHTSFNITGTATGRVSSNDPNLQNIPIRSEEGRRVRRAFIAPEGHVLLSADYSQVELRILAHYSGDTALLDAFRQGLDIHASTAAAVHRIDIKDVTYEQRAFAKSVNFGLMYGMGAFRLAHDSDLTLAEANAFITEYFARFPGVKAYLDGSKELARQQGYLTTLLGRKRYFPALQTTTDAVTRQRIEREAINMPIQGTAADIMKIAMLNLARELKARNYRAAMILQVHDELVLEVPEDEVDVVAPLIKGVMEQAYTLKAPLRADARIGKNWHEMTSYKR